MDLINNKFTLSKNKLNKCLSSFGKDEFEFIEKATNLIKRQLSSNNKIFWCGNGGSASMAEHLSAEFVGRFKLSDRRPLNSISLSSEVSLITAIANDFSFSDIFSRQLEGLGSKEDVLIVLSTSGSSENIINALKKSKELGISSVDFLGKDGGLCKSLADYKIIIDTNETATIQECHLLIGHIICDLIDETFV